MLLKIKCNRCKKVFQTTSKPNNNDYYKMCERCREKERKQYVSVKKSFLVNYPRLEKEWDYDRNGDSVRDRNEACDIERYGGDGSCIAACGIRSSCPHHHREDAFGPCLENSTTRESPAEIMIPPPRHQRTSVKEPPRSQHAPHRPLVSRWCGS